MAAQQDEEPEPLLPINPEQIPYEPDDNEPLKPMYL